MTGAGNEVEQAARWARHSDAAERERLLTALGETLPVERLAASPRAQALLGELLSVLAADAGSDLRLRLSDWVARAPWIPRELAVRLAFDEIDVARPVIARNAALEDADLLRLIEVGHDHAIAVARRPGLSHEVIDAVLEQASPAALAALAANEDVEFTPDEMDRLIGRARRTAGVRAPLARRPELTPELAGALHACSGRRVRAALSARFGPAEALGGAAQPEGGESRLVAKLNASGRLTHGYAVRVLREGKLTLFEQTLVILGDMPQQKIRAALDAETPDPLASVCASAGLDRCVFPMVVSRVRELNEGRPGPAAA